MSVLMLLAALVSDWNGTWAGRWQAGDGIQLIMSGNEPTALFWHGNYVTEDLQAAVSPDGKTLTIHWGSSRAVLQRETNDKARVHMVEPNGHDATFEVSRDR